MFIFWIYEPLNNKQTCSRKFEVKNELSVLAVVYQLQEKEGCEALGKLTATDTDGFSLEEVEGSEVEEGEERQRGEGEQDCSEKQVICIKFVFVTPPPPPPQ